MVTSTNTLVSGKETVLKRRLYAIRQTGFIVAIVLSATFTVGMASASLIV